MLDAFLNRPFKNGQTSVETDDSRHRCVVNSVETAGAQKYLIVCQILTPMLIQLEEIPEQETDRVLREPHFLDNVDVLCLTYDSADSDSFGFIADLRERYPHLNLVPTIYAATKADLDRQEQRYEFQPDTYSRLLGLQPPIHVSALWGATGDLFVQLAEAAGSPGTAVPRHSVFKLLADVQIR